MGRNERSLPLLWERLRISLVWGASKHGQRLPYAAQEAAAQLAAFQEAAAQEAAAQEALFQEADAQLAFAQEAFAQLAAFQDALAQLALAQEALFQLAWFQEAFAVAAFAQLAESKTWPPVPSGPTKALRPRFGFGGLVTSNAPFALTSPTPSAMPAAVGRALSMSAPLTLSGVQLGFFARVRAAAPETTGAEKDVPDIHM
jgi:hypothetical protein